MTRVYDKEINDLIFQKNKSLTELDVVKVQNIKLIEREKVLAAQPIGLNIEVDKLRELLRESSYELEKCKEELVAMDKERISLLAKLSQLGYENDVLQRSRREYILRR